MATVESILTEVVATNKIFVDHWMDAQALSYHYRDTFWAPSEKELSNIKGGDYVKICRGDESGGIERFWTRIIAGGELDGDFLYLAQVYNKLQSEAPYDWKDLVVFGRNNIYNIL